MPTHGCRYRKSPIPEPQAIKKREKPVGHTMQTAISQAKKQGLTTLPTFWKPHTRTIPRAGTWPRPPTRWDRPPPVPTTTSTATHGR